MLLIDPLDVDEGRRLDRLAAVHVVLELNPGHVPSPFAATVIPPMTWFCQILGAGELVADLGG